MDKAGFLARFFALVVDTIVLSIAATGILLVWIIVAAGASQTDSGVLDALQAIVGMFAYLVMLALNFLYYGYFWSKDGQTLGMRMLNIKVVMRTDQPFSFLRAGLRGSLGYTISGFLFGLGYLWAAFDPNGEAWHDKIFDTRVVRA